MISVREVLDFLVYAVYMPTMPVHVHTCKHTLTEQILKPGQGHPRPLCFPQGYPPPRSSWDSEAKVWATN